MITRKPLFLSIVYTNVIYKKNDTNLIMRRAQTMPLKLINSQRIDRPQKPKITKW